MKHPDLPRETTKTYAQLINTAALDAASVIRRLRELYRDKSEGVIGEPVDLRRCIDEVVAMTQPRWKNQALAQGIAIRVDTRVDDVPRFSGDAAGIREMLANLIFNAVDAMPTGGTITVRVRRTATRYVSKSATPAPAWGSRSCTPPSSATAGPCRSRASRDGAAPSSCGCRSSASPRGSPRTSVAQLNSQGHTVETATNGREGLDRFRTGRFDLVVTDRAMPEMGGDQLAAAIKRSAPETPVIMLTGFGDLMAAKGERPPGVDAVVGKPVTLDALNRAILKVIRPPLPARR